MTIPLCKTCKHTLLAFVDEVNSTDAELFAIASLCEAATDRELIDEDTLQELGRKLKRHLAQHRILRHHFFGEPLNYYVDEGLARAELYRLSAQSREREQRRAHGQRPSKNRKHR